jgi:hypothetical protein
VLAGDLLRNQQGSGFQQPGDVHASILLVQSTVCRTAGIRVPVLAQLTGTLTEAVLHAAIDDGRLLRTSRRGRQQRFHDDVPAAGRRWTFSAPVQVQHLASWSAGGRKPVVGVAVTAEPDSIELVKAIALGCPESPKRLGDRAAASRIRLSLGQA